ncbi:MAG: type II toxin-antitoxin system HicB family antitoxin [Thermoleophilia bacterium]
MQRTIKAYVYPGESGYVAECAGLAVVTQGRTLDETVANLQEAVALYLEGEDLTGLDLEPNPSLIITFEVETLADAG